ncbi:MAG: 2Fe-2S iron-sulfur cluster-binding protein [Chloroflexota bacterium]
MTYVITFIALNGEETTLQAKDGENLRQFLLDNLSDEGTPYTKYTKKLNCRGRGICATCGVWIAENESLSPEHWHDKAAKAFGYPRLSCQVAIRQDLTVFQVDKWLWGTRNRSS